MITVTTTIEVDVIYDVDDVETIAVDIRITGGCKKIDKNQLIERYAVDLKWESLTWDKEDFSTIANKAIANYVETNKQELASIFYTIIIEKCK